MIIKMSKSQKVSQTRLFRYHQCVMKLALASPETWQYQSYTLRPHQRKSTMAMRTLAGTMLLIPRPGAQIIRSNRNQPMILHQLPNKLNNRVQLSKIQMDKSWLLIMFNKWCKDNQLHLIKQLMLSCSDKIIVAVDVIGWKYKMSSKELIWWKSTKLEQLMIQMIF